ncbi:putative receptor like protein 25 [Eucalyptus grandis]|uniref:putative receptor like protein 25 n=1 Tax=Eucalyptus grandis TaxID=71139 RepID=UPI00192EB1BA|nr:putative receptor like protein 25 [Eucalyptus grandis]
MSPCAWNGIFCNQVGNVITIDLTGANVEGTFNEFPFSSLPHLMRMELSENNLSGYIPPQIGLLSNLTDLDLSKNWFSGKIPSEIDFPKVAHLFPKLHILDLSNNGFTGPLPVNLIEKLQGMMNGQNGQGLKGELYMRQPVARGFYEDSVNVTMKGNKVLLVKILTIFIAIDLSLNSFHGDIPSIIGNLYYLKGLNLSHNHLTGSIPSTLGNLTHLEWLDLSSNKFSGRVPRELGDLSFLGCLNLSKNQLTGRIPQDKQLSTFMSNSFWGNVGLCGTPLQKWCPDDAPPPRLFFQDDSTREHGSGFDGKAVGIGYASGIVIGISIAHILWETGRPKWLMGKVRSTERRAKLMKKSKRKAIKFHGDR